MRALLSKPERLAQKARRSIFSLITYSALLAPASILSQDQDVRHPETRPSDSSVMSMPSAHYARRIVREGIAVDFTVEHHDPRKAQMGELREGDDVIFRFKISDTATGSPLASVKPAAWVSRVFKDEQTDRQKCTDKIEVLVRGSLLGRADLDLNVYYVLALNDDASISVVDPLFGYGGTKLLAMILLQSSGEDWALTSDQNTLFVSTPEANQLVVVETPSWTVVTSLKLGPRPTRVALQPDEAYLWVSYNVEGVNGEASGVAVVRVRDLVSVARIPTGRGRHELAFSPDSRFAFVTNQDEGTVSVIDVRTLKKVKDLPSGRKPVSIAFSTLAQAAFVSDEADGTITVIDTKSHEIVARMKAESGLGQIKFAPGDRLGFVVNPQKNLVHILDAALNRIIQTGEMGKGPDQIAFSTELAYVRHRDSELVFMIPLKEIGVEKRPVPVIDFPGGQNPLGKTSRPSPADTIIQASGENAVLVANPADKTIYYYREGMAAPMGNFSNYGREPRAVLLVDRSLRERSPGVYQTVARLGPPGQYDVSLFLTNPRIVQCFDLSIASNPALTQKRNARAVQIKPLIEETSFQTGTPVRVRVKLVDQNTGEALTDLKDVSALVLAPGIWQGRPPVESVGEGIYAFDFTPPRPGIYVVHIACSSIHLNYTASHSLDVKDAPDQEKR
jgi:YVTN family beta-propeller protein